MNATTERPEAVLFDVDGTLLDSVPLFIEMSAELIRELGAPPVPEAHIRALMSEATPDLLLKILPEDFPDAKQRVEALMAANMARFMERYHQESRLLPDAVETVQELAAGGFVLGLATSSGRALPFLDRCGLRDHFAAIVGREDVARHKPHPEPLLLCAERITRDPGRCMYVGDSLVDIRAARAAGMTAVAIPTGTSPRERLAEEGPDLLLGRLSELPSLLAT
ncbi:MAG: HAD family hydrolase [Myxococcales bacterium]|nr:HAD family hydrolase [Myxococcales bacterium]